MEGESLVISVEGNVGLERYFTLTPVLVPYRFTCYESLANVPFTCSWVADATLEIIGHEGEATTAGGLLQG